jgi:glycosyltransferase involved in cell wall biosynthesis
LFWTLVRWLRPFITPTWLERWRVKSARKPRYRPPVTSPLESRRILVDLTTIARHDARTGIQRVVRSIATQMCRNPGTWTIQPIRHDATGYRLVSWPIDTFADQGPLLPQAGDVFLGLDLSLDAIRKNARHLLRFKQQGMQFWFVVYDLLPIHSPQYFSAKLVVRFHWWFTTVAKLADGFICISQHIADELHATLLGRFGLTKGVHVRVIPMGFDIETTTPATRAVMFPPWPIDLKQSLVLAVGTLEPRKGYGELLDAFELLWARGSNITFIIVGVLGWKTETLQRRIMEHRLFRRQLYWLKLLDDAGLELLYARADAVVAASYAEGYGLPVLEAIARGCPVLARDIPAFRIHAERGLHYFPSHATAAQIAEALDGLLDKAASSERVPARQPLPTWRDASDALLSILSRV